MTPETRQGQGNSLVGALLERRYRVDSVIARGGMSTVYRGLDTRLERPVALKVMDARYSGDRSFVERFEREARAAAKLHHNDVVAVYDQGVDREADGDHVFLVMELVEGCTLRDLIIDRGGKLPLAMALSVMQPVLSALAAAHRAGMVHRDVKPENVLIGNDGSVKVADFGLVRAAAEAGTTSGSVILGTVAYLSPEQVTTGAADARTDVYAAGVVLYEMLTGRPPFVGDTAMSVAYQHVNDDVPPPAQTSPEVPPELDALVVRATRREPAQRPADAEAFLAELEQVRSDLGIAPVAVPVPASEAHTAVMPPVADPPTEQFPTVRAQPTRVEPAPMAQQPRHHTRALARPATDELDAPPPGAGMEPRRKGRRNGALWAVVVLVLAALVGGAAFWLGFGNYVAVPKLVGTSEQQAVQSLESAGLSANVTKENDNDVPEGIVLSSNPGEGSQVRSGGSVDLVVSLGKPAVPEISSGMTVAEAENLLRNAKLQPQQNSSSRQYHRTVPEGRVISVDPAPGTRVDLNSAVTLIVSKGPPPVQVPDVRGMSRDDAFTTLSNAGFEPYDAGQQFDGDVDAGKVVSTNPTTGTEVKLVGRPRIGVVVSNAVPVPSLNGMKVTEAQQQVAQLGLQLNVQALFQRQDMVILGQYPLPGSRVEPGSALHVTAF
ncbi:Stk1 family PASTA domain-containing Ser/Thr kinase [Saccharopolyspora rhizosphaerae]|uniref:non-specific serine/threonine protein kinase n=1 Tax=Saccharopolyspora rhizosphaerae TaxID=2492662 RepID=A0A426JPA9_9PSEU|nr:Stk1 family PASTA domain-containing Ser/Thr kinase [Saccharopolyspora rhizosphaerae]RRO14877.1 Stk1 family PASTA domain-containing Ser/Thr kinase [Saccharopolyspora rhizosphaerae]